MSNRLTCAFGSTLAFLTLATICLGSAVAQQVKIGDLVIDHAWARATPAGAKVGGGYLTIENKGATPDKLVGGSTRAAGKVEVHETAMNNGVATMRPVKDGLSIPAGQSVTLAPGGYHLMMTDLKGPLKRATSWSLRCCSRKLERSKPLLTYKALAQRVQVRWTIRCRACSSR